MSDQIPSPSESDIAELAHRYWEEEGKPEGKAEEHWQRAKAQLGIEDPAEVLPQPTGN